MDIRHKIKQWKDVKNTIDQTLELWSVIAIACKTEGITLRGSRQLLLARGIIAHYRTHPNRE